MPSAAAGSNIIPFPSDPSEEQAESVTLPITLDELRGFIHEEMSAAVADVERRLGQAREIERAVASGMARETVHAEDLNVAYHLIDGYNLYSNSNGTVTTPGSIAWANLRVVYLGVDYKIANGFTSKKYVWFVKPGTYIPGTTPDIVLNTGDTVPVLSPDDQLLFVNNGGSAVVAGTSGVAYAVGNGVVTPAALDTTLTTTLSNIDDTLDSIQAQVDGAITSYFQDEPPWPEGSAPPGDPTGNIKTGDIWYDSNDGGAFRWTGNTGNAGTRYKWVRIADTSTAEIAALVNTKVTTYVGTSAPVAPSGGFTKGDMWIDTTAGGNVLKRWSGADGAPANSWVTLQFGDAAISGVGAGKVSGVLAAANIPNIDLATKTTGTLQGSKVGTGVNAANVNSGTLPIGQVPQIGVSKINAAMHMLY